MYYRSYLNVRKSEKEISVFDAMVSTLQDISITQALIYDELVATNLIKRKKNGN